MINARALWYLGQVLLVITILFAVFLPLCFSKFLRLYEFIEFNERKHTFFLTFCTFLLVAFCWVYFSSWWRKKSYQLVFKEEVAELDNRYQNKTDSYLLAKWGDISLLNKIFRLTAVSSLFALALYGDYYRNETDRKFEEFGVETEVRILSITESVKKRTVYLDIEFTHNVNGQECRHISKPLSGYFINSKKLNGFEILENDSFKAAIITDEFEEIRIDFKRPISKTLDRYKAFTTASLMRNVADSIAVDCFVAETYREFGLDGWAKLSNREISFLKNENYNYVKYQLLMGKPQMHDILKNCDVFL